MNVKVYNSLTNKLEEFKPLEEGIVNIYVCGPTVYDDLHIGNSRPIITFDILRRLFEHLGQKVNYVSNITDVDDKIIKNAKKLGITEEALISITIDKYMKVLKDLNIVSYTFQPKATEYIDQMIKYIQELIDNEYAYEIDGDVYFRMSRVKDYGKISNQNIEDLIINERIVENDKKENQLDFTLWKATQEGISWPAFGSFGRPGWHTECVVMINEIFSGKQIDIHAGGMDLKFPHHENELCQCEAHSKHELATYWMHNGFINFDGAKMSKSIGNVITIKDFIDEHDGNTLRMLMLMSDYKKPLNITDEVIQNAKANNNKIIDAINFAGIENSSNSDSENLSKMIEELKNDLNTSQALKYVFDEVSNVNSGKLKSNSLVTMLNILGISINEVPKEIVELAQKRLDAKNNKDFELADEYRNQIEELGFNIIDRGDKFDIRKA